MADNINLLNNHKADIIFVFRCKYENRINDLDYADESELLSAASEPTCVYYAEAKAVIKKYWENWAKIETYFNQLTEQTINESFAEENINFNN